MSRAPISASSSDAPLLRKRLRGLRIARIVVGAPEHAAAIAAEIAALEAQLAKIAALIGRPGRPRRPAL